MKRLCLNSNNELILIDLDLVAYFQSDGNYTIMHMCEGMKVFLSIGLGGMERLIADAYVKGESSPFIRLGRKFIINQKYLFQINISKQRLVLSDMKSVLHTLEVSKTLLKSYKELIRSGYKTGTGHDPQS